VVAGDRVWVQADGAHLNVLIRGEGPLVVLMPSLGRGADDFDALTQELAGAGYRAAAVDPRGAAQSSGATGRLTLHNYAEDLAAVVKQLGDGPAHIVGHGFGNRAARCLAADHPDLVQSLSLLACGSRADSDPEARAALKTCFRLDLPREERMQAVALAFFAPGNDPSPWEDGWWPCVASAEVLASRSTPVDEWWPAGTAPMLVIQGLHDRISPPASEDDLQGQFGERVSLVNLDNAAHALLPEAPDRVAEEVVSYLARISG
jgi:pimeloyl-ACP methyl ester carboxylesterase